MSTTLVAVDLTAADVVAFDPAILAGQLAPSSINQYRKDFAAYVHFAGSADAALRPSTLAAWRAVLAADTALSPNTINRMLAAVKRLLKEAAVHDYIDRATAADFAPIAGVKPAALKERTKQHARTKITKEDMRRLCSLPDGTTLIG